MNVDGVLSRLEGVHGGDGHWSARCPAHDDRQASLTVGVGRDGQVMLTCWAGCEFDAIVRALGMRVRDLFPSQSELALGGSPERVSLAAAALPTELEITKYAERLQRSGETLRMLLEVKGWRAGTCAVLELGLVGDRIAIPLRDPTGKLVNFLRYSPNGQARGPKVLAEAGFPRAPFYAIVDDTRPVWIVEGEGDAISMANVGLNVIGAPGASAKARAEWLEVVRGRDVIVCMDADEPGRKAAQRWARTARGRDARSVRVVELEGPKGYDVGELVRELRDDLEAARARLLELAEAAPEWSEQVVRVDVNGGLCVSVDDDAIAALETGSLILRAAASV